MRVVVQRVSSAAVTINGEVTGQIGTGLLVLVGIEAADDDQDIAWLAHKIVNLRIFSDGAGLMNQSLLDVGGELLVVSQFTLHALTKKGNRPSYINAARPEIAVPLYEKFKEALQSLVSHRVQAGIFGADMKVSLLNDGPVTIVMDSKNRE